MASDFSNIHIEAAVLEPVIQRLLVEPAATIEDGWSCLPLGGGGGGGLGLYQVKGNARTPWSAICPWTLILKVSAAANGADPRSWDYPAREGLAYRSGMLETLPGGIGVPRCLGVEAQPDGTSWLWLEKIIDETPGLWSVDQYALAARHLGRFNGAYLAGMPLRDQPWLSRGWLRQFTELSGPKLATLERLSGAGGPGPVQRLYPRPVVAELRRLWDEREAFLSMLDRLPRTMCHFDAFRRNFLSRATAESEGLVLIDWPFVGPGAVGEDLVALVLGSLFFFEAQGIEPAELDAVCFSAYVAGLREASWTGDERLARLGFTAAAALRYTVSLLHEMLPGLCDPINYPGWEALFRRPLMAALDSWVDLWPFQFGLADEARSLSRMTER